MPIDDYSPDQIAGSEYGGTEARATVQPKGPDAVTPGDKLRLEYLTGIPDPIDPQSIEDHRQFYGLLPADKLRPYWLEGTGRESEADIRGVGER